MKEILDLTLLSDLLGLEISEGALVNMLLWPTNLRQKDLVQEEQEELAKEDLAQEDQKRR